MSASRVDWAVLRGSIGLFAICLLIGGILLSASHYFREEMESEFSNYQSKFRDVSRKYLAVDDEEKIIQNVYPEFLRLQAEGILGREHRLSWIEVLRGADRELQLPQLNYEINAQSVLEADYPVNLGAFDIYVSEMRLSAGLLHEGDLFRLLRAFDERAEGLYSVSKCEIERSLEHFAGIDRPAISAECQLNWYTVDLKGNRSLGL